jgi:hypothetical protein
MLLDSIRRNLGKQSGRDQANLPFTLSRTSGKRHQKRFGEVLLVADWGHPTPGRLSRPRLSSWTARRRENHNRDQPHFPIFISWLADPLKYSILGPGSGYFGQQCVLLAGAREVWICQKDGRMLFTGLTNDEMAKIIPLCCSDSQHLQSCQR